MFKPDLERNRSARRPAEVFILAFVGVLALGSVLFYRESAVLFHQSLGSDLVVVAQAAANMLDGEAHQEIVRNKDPRHPAYRQMEDVLVRLQAHNPRIRNIYTLVPALLPATRDQRRWLVVLDAAAGAGTERQAIGHPYDMEGRADQHLACMKALSEPGFTGLYTDEFGTWLSAYVPLRDAKGVTLPAVVGVDMSVDQVRAIERRLIMIALGIFFTAGLFGVWIIQRLARWLVTQQEQL